MSLNVNWYDVEKYLLKWLRVLNYVRGLRFKSYVCHLCVVWFIIIIILIIYLCLVSDSIIIAF